MLHGRAACRNASPKSGLPGSHGVQALDRAMRVRLRMNQGLLLIVLLTLSSAACEDDPHDLDYLKDSGANMQDAGMDDSELDAATAPTGDDDAG
jgi:hypothetical protein